MASPKNAWEVQVNVAFSNKDQFKSVPGTRYSGSGGWWYVPLEAAGQALGLPDQPAPKPAALPPGIAARLRPHQVEGVGRALASPGGYLLGWATGLGKSYGAMAVAQQRDARRILVVAPANGKRHWAKVAADWGYSSTIIWPDAVDGWCQRTDSDYRPSRHVTIVNYELLERVPTTPEASGWDLIVADEVHYLKNTHNGNIEKAPKRTRLMFQLRDQYPNAYRLALSATPAADRAIDLWGQLDWLHPGRWGRFWSYAFYFHETAKGEHGVVIGPPREERQSEHRRRLEAVCHNVAHHEVEMVPQTLEVVRPDADQEHWSARIHPKLAVLCDARKQVDAIAEQHPAFVAFHGKGTPKTRGKKIEAALLADRPIVCTMHSIREAIDLTHWNDVVYAQVSYQLLPVLQSMGRFRRLSSASPVSYRFYVSDVLEERKVKALVRKAAEIRALIPAGADVDEWLAKRYAGEEMHAELAALDLDALGSVDWSEEVA